MYTYIFFYQVCRITDVDIGCTRLAIDIKGGGGEENVERREKRPRCNRARVRKVKFKLAGDAIYSHE